MTALESVYLGTYPVRRIGKSENGIHMPQEITGNFSIYKNLKTRVVTLIPQDTKTEVLK